MVSHTPKRGVGSSNLFWDARKLAANLCFQGLAAFLFTFRTQKTPTAKPWAFGLYRLEKTLNENDEDQNGEDPLEVDLELRGELEPLTFIGLGQILVKAPAPLRDAEQKVDQRTNRQQQVRDDEVLAVQNIARADDVDIRPDIVAKHARKTQNEKRYTANERCLFPAPAEGVHADGKNVLKHGKHRREACKDHKQEEQRAPDAAARHIDKDVRKGLENKRRALIGLNICINNNKEQPSLQDRIYDTKGISTTITTGNFRPNIAETTKMPMFNPYNKSEIKEIAPTQTRNCGNINSSAAVLITEDGKYCFRIRKLTPKECWRLMRIFR